MFQDKKILIIASEFFGYENKICEKLTSLGAEVFYKNERPSNDFVTKVLIRINRKLTSSSTNEYYENIIGEHSSVRLDYILLIRGESVSANKIKKLKESQPQAKLILYLWDSFHYNPNAKLIYKQFDKVVTFDLMDSKYDENIKNLPLFYSDEFQTEGNGDLKYDWCFIGTVHTDRYKVLNGLMIESKRKGISFFCYCYYPSKRLAFIRGIFDWRFASFIKKNAKFKGIKLQDVAKHMSNSLAVVDINRPHQNGLTMRTLETLGANRLLITTSIGNEDVDIFPLNSVSKVDRANVILNKNFFDRKKISTCFANKNKYTIENWLKELFQ
jgi:hypothetical protein